MTEIGSRPLCERGQWFSVQYHFALQRQPIHLLLYFHHLFHLDLLSFLYLLTCFLLLLFISTLASQILQQSVVLLELSLETIVGADLASLAADILQGLTETHGFSAHKKDEDEGGGLNGKKSTLEMPAAQCTSTFPLLSPSLIN